MRKPLVTSALMMLYTLACGPETGDENDPPGKLEYEELYNRIYRQDHRIDVIKELPGEDGVRRECGLLTSRGYDDLEGTLESLDPSTDYSEHPADCSTYGALVHIEGFEHSPFECAAECCHSDLLRAAIVYSVILNNFYGIMPVIDGEPYVAIEPDQPCS